MKKLLILVAVFSIGLFGCKKDKATPAESVMEYTINGISDVNYEYNKLTIPISLAYTSGPQDKINLSITGLPAGMKANFSTVSGTPTFGAILEITHDTYITSGTYNVNIVGTDFKGRTKMVAMKVTVPINCGSYMTGSYTVEVTDPLGNALFNDIYTLSTKPGDPNKVYFYPSGQAVEDFYANLNCDNKTLEVPMQGDKKGSGFYTLSPNYLQLNLTSSAFPLIYKCTKL